MKQVLTAIDGVNINDMRGTAYKGNYLQLSNRKLYFAGMPVAQLRLSNKPLFKSSHLYDIVSNSMEIGQIALNENDYKEVQRVLNAEPKNKSIYQNAKDLMKSTAKELKRTNTDKPYIRYELNNMLDSMCRQFDFYAMKETISQKKADLYKVWLSSYTCNLHP